MKRTKSEYAELEKILTEKTTACNYEIGYMLCRLQSMFKYENLPLTIPATELELSLQLYGDCFLTQVNGKFYALTGNAGGEYDEYNNPTLYIVDNPALKLSRSFKIGVEGIRIKNDTLSTGMLPLLKKYCVLLTENHISIRQAIINARALSIISANDDKTKVSADMFLKKLVDGELSAIAEQPFFDGIKSFDVAAGVPLRQLLEGEQYIKATMYHDFGIDANVNMKRSVVSSFEAEMNDDFLLPLVDNFYDCRFSALQAFNALYGLNVKVDFNSTWKTNQIENLKEQQLLLTTELEQSKSNLTTANSELEQSTNEISELKHEVARLEDIVGELRKNIAEQSYNKIDNLTENQN